ncbi:MAG TPA: Gfo/Idh/MocA family oxidoreductase [bacterium]|nr:Gfo/Idh/MocA family oxidoreductase [bacterium]HQL62820.1 Gfo/Idh/MocA family oxidoreductase [bacterium]
MGHTKITRRLFLTGTAATALAGCATPARRPKLSKTGYRSPNEKLNIAGIGVGGKGSSDIDNCRSENIVALCDVDWVQGGPTFERYPKAKRYRDFRDMLEKEERNIDACTISTTDHVHAVAAMMAMKMGKHVYVQKPLTHTIYEARMLREAARKYGVATQMGNQGHSGDDVRKFCELIWSGIIGNVREVHAWTDRPIWPQGIPEPLPEEPIPDDKDINWDLWIGPAPYRPYNSKYAPFNWRGWWDFGTGALGDMGCHILDPANWALLLEYPISVECVSQEGKNKQTAPNKSIIRYEFPARESMAPVTVYWYDGGNLPKRPKEIPEGIKLADGDNGSLFIGEKGVIAIGTYGGNPQIFPESLAKEYKEPEPLIPRAPGEDHARDWLQACMGGPPACSNFDYSGPFTEWVLLGNLCLRCEGKLLWDGPNMRVTNNSEANQYVRMKYRKGWHL